MSIIVMTNEEQQPQQPVTANGDVEKPAGKAQEHRHDSRVVTELCSGCAQLQIDVARTINIVMERMDKLQDRLDELLKENELKKSLESSSASSGKVTPTSTGSRSSPKLEQTQNQVQQPAQQRKTVPSGGASGARKRKPKERTSPALAAASPLPDFSNFVNGFMFDPMNMTNQSGMMQLLSLVQQQNQQDHRSSMSPPEPKVIKTEEQIPKAIVKEESPAAAVEDPAAETQNLIDVLTAQFCNQQNQLNCPQAATSSSYTSTPSASSSCVASAAAAVQQVVEAVATPSRCSHDFSALESSTTNGGVDSNTARCSNCRTDKTTAWRRDAEGQLVCNPCGLYYRLHKVQRPIEMRKNHIQQRYRRKNKENKDVVAAALGGDSSLFSQLVATMPTMTAAGGGAAAAVGQAVGPGAAAANALSMLEQITQFTQAHELMMNNSASF